MNVLEKKEIATLRLVIAQCNLFVGDVPGNAERIISLSKNARDTHKADLIVFPELTLTGYPPEDLLLRPGLQRMVDRALDKILSEVSNIHVLIGYPAQEGDKRFNAASILFNGKILAVCHKHHLPNYSVFDERRYFSSGEGYATTTINNINLGITICEDIWRPEPARLAADAGAQMLVNINASPFNSGKGAEREAVVAQRVSECGIPIVYANLVGGQDELVFDGESFVINQEGSVTQRCPACAEDLFPVDFEVTDGKVNPLPAEVAARLSDVAAVYQTLVLGVRDYITKAGFKGAVIGLSGGIDSALTLAIAVDAIGAEQVEAVMMPSRYTAQMSRDDAQAQADAQGVAYQEISIEPVFNAFLESLNDAFTDTKTDTTEENIQARCRGVILMALSNKRGLMVLTTGNKSEMSVGYATLYGDMAGGYAPIKDVPKLLVYQLAEYRNSITPVIPQRVIDRPPSAELAPDQKDEDSLPPYEVLDPLLEGYIEKDQSISELVAQGFDEAIVKRIAALVDRNEYKRRQAPPGVRISRRAFGRDRRYPIISGYLKAQLKK
jgi:NAD+ synthase (glutamine-hydrolysing)